MAAEELSYGVSVIKQEVKPKTTAVIALALFVSTHKHLAHLHLAFVRLAIRSLTAHPSVVGKPL
ncbi:MAG: hypothetical protein NC230_05700, partial [Bacteroides sp.]|nr:hypothetical protein [Bacteroides sp.]